MFKKTIRRLLVIHFFMAICCAPVRADSLIDLFSRQEPGLFALYQHYPDLRIPLTKYARGQGFVRPVEELATVAHELVHIDSAAHSGFYVDGIYYEPYLRRDAWPQLTSSEVLPYVLPSEHSAATLRYAQTVPNATVGNIVDEINAYAHVLRFVCRNDQEGAQRQLDRISGFLTFLEVYLRVLRVSKSAEYRALQVNREARGALLLITDKAYAAVGQCAPTWRIQKTERELLKAAR